MEKIITAPESLRAMRSARELRRPPMENKICPLLALHPNPDAPASCQGDRCAWWDYLACACCLVSLADYTRTVSESLEDLSAGKEAAP